MASLSLLFSLESPSSTSDLKINVGLCLCAVSQNCGLPGLPVPYGATCCLSDHLAIRRLLRREKLNHPRTPREFLLLLKCALAPSCVFPHNLITLSVCNYKLHLPLPPPISLIFLLSSCLVSSPLRLLSVSSDKACSRAHWQQLLKKRTVLVLFPLSAFPSQSWHLNQ